MAVKPQEAHTPKKSQIGRCGELLVQYELLRRGIESAPMTTDAGVDLVAYPPGKTGAVTIQVKTNLRPKRAGGKGPLLLSWGLAKRNPAQLIALVHLEANRIWLMTFADFKRQAQQKKRDKMLLYRYIDAYPAKRRRKRPKTYRTLEDFAEFQFACQAPTIFGRIAK